MSEPIDISKLRGIKKFFAKLCDRCGEKGLLDTEKELSIFGKVFSVKEDEIKDSFEQRTKSEKSKEELLPNNAPLVLKEDATRVAKPVIIEKIEKFKEYSPDELRLREISTLIDMECLKRKIKLSDEDTNYWANIVKNVADKYNFSERVIVGIIAQESTFKKNISVSSGAGPMQITTATTSDFYDSYRQNNVYKLLNPELLDDVMYETTQDGNKVLRYSTPRELRNACAKDDEYGVKVGVLCFQQKYVTYASKMLGLSLKETIIKLKDGTIKLTPEQQEKCIQQALQLYNSVDGIKEEYSKNICDSLQNMRIQYDSVKILS